MSEDRILICGVGNPLRQDDAFGSIVAERLIGLADEGKLGHGVRVIETGIGGISLVQELFDDFEALLLIDAVDRDWTPGEIRLLSLEVPDLRGYPERERQAFLADVHYATPERALMLARAVGKLPAAVFMLGCQSGGEDFALGMTPAVRRAVPKAVRFISSWVDTWMAERPNGQSSAEGVS